MLKKWAKPHVNKTDTKTKVEERRTPGTALCVGLICPGSVWNSGVYEGGADHRIIVETMEVLKRVTKRTPIDVEVGTKRRILNPKCKHDTEVGGATAELPWKLLELWPGY